MCYVRYIKCHRFGVPCGWSPTHGFGAGGFPHERVFIDRGADELGICGSAFCPNTHHTPLCSCWTDTSPVQQHMLYYSYFVLGPDEPGCLDHVSRQPYVSQIVPRRTHILQNTNMHLSTKLYLQTFHPQMQRLRWDSTSEVLAHRAFCQSSNIQTTLCESIFGAAPRCSSPYSSMRIPVVVRTLV